MAKWEYETNRIVWYAEIGMDDGTELGRWVKTVESWPFPTKEEAENYLRSRDDIEEMRWGGFRKNRPYFEPARVRRGVEKIGGEWR